MLRESAGAVMNASWEVQAFEGDPAPLVIVSGDTCVAECFITGEKTESVEKAVSNALLIAAAPDLLHALQNLIGYREKHYRIPDHAIETAKKAVLKATGGSDHVATIN